MILVYTQRLNVKVTLSLGRETKMCTVGMLVWAERAARHVGALYANIPKSFQIHNLPPTGVRIGGGVGGVEPPTSPCRPPYLWSKFAPGGVEFQPPHLRFAGVGMLLDSHFLVMQFLKYLGLHHDDLNVITS